MPKLLTDEEADHLGRRPFGRKHFVFVLIDQLQPRQKLLVTRQDFTWRRHTPNIFVRRIMKSSSKKFKVTNTNDGSGWIVERME